MAGGQARLSAECGCAYRQAGGSGMIFCAFLRAYHPFHNGNQPSDPSATGRHCRHRQLGPFIRAGHADHPSCAFDVDPKDDDAGDIFSIEQYSGQNWGDA